MDITLQEAITTFAGSYRPAIIHFCKADGTIRQMVCVKRNKMSNDDGSPVKKSNFGYRLDEHHALLVNELAGYLTEKKKVKGVGTVHVLKERPDVNKIILANERLLPRTIKIHSIVEFNGSKIKTPV